MWSDALKDDGDRGGLASNGLAYTDLLDMAEWREGPDVEIARAGSFTGVSLPDHTMITTSAARKLASQLFLMADIHDAVYDNGFEAGAKVGQAEVARCRTALRRIMVILNKPGPVSKTGKNAIIQEIDSLGMIRLDTEQE